MRGNNRWAISQRLKPEEPARGIAGGYDCEEEPMVEVRKDSDGAWEQGVPDPRSKPRFNLEVEMKISSRSCGELVGQSTDISESGVSAMLKIEVPLGEMVHLGLDLPLGAVEVLASVRQRNAFRYGFHFVDFGKYREIILATCRSLEMEQSLKRGAGAG
jgi:hypothetical protein